VRALQRAHAYNDKHAHVVWQNDCGESAFGELAHMANRLWRIGIWRNDIISKSSCLCIINSRFFRTLIDSFLELENHHCIFTHVHSHALWRQQHCTLYQPWLSDGKVPWGWMDLLNHLKRDRRFWKDCHPTGWVHLGLDCQTQQGRDHLDIAIIIESNLIFHFEMGSWIIHCWLKPQ